MLGASASLREPLHDPLFLQAPATRGGERRWRRILSARPPALFQFYASTLTYVLSRQWKDLIVVHLLRTQPPPYCGADVHNTTSAAAFLPCTAAAPAVTQALLALLLLVASPLIVRHSADRSTTVPTLVGMCVGCLLYTSPSPRDS